MKIYAICLFLLFTLVGISHSEGLELDENGRVVFTRVHIVDRDFYRIAGSSIQFFVGKTTMTFSKKEGLQVPNIQMDDEQLFVSTASKNEYEGYSMYEGSGTIQPNDTITVNVPGMKYIGLPTVTEVSFGTPNVTVRVRDWSEDKFRVYNGDLTNAKVFTWRVVGIKKNKRR